MKKITLAIAVLFATTAFAQDLTSKMGEAYLPEAGEWAIGIDAKPFLDYFGNFIGGDTLNASPTFTPHSDDLINYPGVTVFGKMFIDANTAYRGRVRIGFGSLTTKTLVEDDTDDQQTVEDTEKISYTNIVLGAGIEKRKGNSRLQGIYGAEASIGFGAGKVVYDYGNDAADALTSNNEERILEAKLGGTMRFTASGFIGAEYFFAPKVSIGGEYLWGINFSNNGAGSIEKEVAIVNPTTNEIEIDSQSGDGTVSSRSFGLDTNVAGSFSLRLMLHF